MAWRTFAVFLLALNLAAFTFAWLNPKAAPPAPSATEANVTTLVLLSERDAEQMRTASQAAGMTPNPVQAEPAARETFETVPEPMMQPAVSRRVRAAS